MNLLDKLFKFTFFALLLLGPGSSLRAQVLVEAKIDSLRILIGEQATITLDVTCDANQHPELPRYDIDLNQGRVGVLATGVEVVQTLAPDTTLLNEGKRMQISKRYVVTSFDSALYYIPPFEVRIDTSRYTSNALALQVYSQPCDTTHLDRFFGIADIEKQAFTWADWKETTYSGLFLVLLALLTALAWWWLRHGNPVIPLMRRKPKLPPHQVAMQEIARIKEQRAWATEDSKDYYTQLTDTLRTYIQERYGFRAMDMTSSQIIERLEEENDTQALAELTELFQTADLVKFAKMTTAINENDAHLLTAVNYINQTKREVEPEADKQPLYTTEQRKTIGVRIALITSIVLMGLGMLTLLVLMVLRLYDLLA